MKEKSADMKRRIKAEEKSTRMAVNVIHDEILVYSAWYVGFRRTQFVKCPKYCNLHRDVIRKLVQAKKAIELSQ